MLRPRFLLPLFLLLVACSGAPEGYQQEIETLLAEGELIELEARLELYQQEGVDDAWVHYGLGRVRLAENADRPALTSFRLATATDSSMGSVVAAAWSEASAKDLEAGWKERALRRLQWAMEADPTLDPGLQKQELAEQLYERERNYSAALPLYRRILAESAGASAAMRADLQYRIGNCQAEIGSPAAALATFEDLLNRFPKGDDLRRDALAHRARLLFNRAQARRAQGESDAALEDVAAILAQGWPPDLQRQSAFLAGEIERDRGGHQSALRWYTKVLDQGGAGETVSTAKERIEELHAMGVW